MERWQEVSPQDAGQESDKDTKVKCEIVDWIRKKRKKERKQLSHLVVAWREQKPMPQLHQLLQGSQDSLEHELNSGLSRSEE